jgi:SAM-dependent methyltransferase
VGGHSSTDHAPAVRLLSRYNEVAMEEELVRLRRERLEADRRYNDALTTLDRVVVQLGGHEQLSGGDLEAVGTALMRFLQQITPFVETKDRERAAVTGAGLAHHQEALEALVELRTQVGVLHRSFQMLRRERPPESTPTRSAQVSEALGGGPAAVRRGPIPIGSTRKPGSPGDALYVAFEDRFRGSPQEIRAKLRDYIPLFTGASDVLDIGCGRGELLALFRNHGIAARGVDANPEMVASARDEGLDVVESDVLDYLASLPDASLGGLIGVQIIEHLEPAAVMNLIELAFGKLRPGSTIALETINPACWLAFFSSYIRDLTHVRPIHPETLQYLMQANGFERVSIEYKAPVPEQVRMKSVDVPPVLAQAVDPARRPALSPGSSAPANAVDPADIILDAVGRIAHTVNANTAILNHLLFTHLDYAAIGHR